MVYINSLLPHCLRNDFDNLFVNGIEGIVFEMTIKQKKWLICTIYKPPNIKDTIFISCFSKVFEEMFSETQCVLFIGDFNFNMNVDNTFSDCCTVLGLSNLIKGNTCFKGMTPTLLDVFLTANKSLFVNDCLNYDIGLSDCHNIVGCVLKAYAPKKSNKILRFRSFFNKN